MNPYARLSSGPQSPLGAVWRDAAVMRAIGAKLPAVRPLGLTGRIPPRVGASRPELWGEPGGIRAGLSVPRKSLSYSSSWIPAPGALGYRVRRGRVPSHFSVPLTPTSHPDGSSEAITESCGHSGGYSELRQYQNMVLLGIHQVLLLCICLHNPLMCNCCLLKVFVKITIFDLNSFCFL